MLSINTSQQSPTSFGRQLKQNEIKPYTQTIEQSLSKLGKEIDIILHNSSAPSVEKENTGIGSLLSTTYEQKVVPFLKKHVIKSIQTEPDGLRKGTDGSPYVGDTFAKNVLMIPLEKLQTEKYGKILSGATFQNIVQSRPNKQANRVDYSYVVPKYETALKEAYETFTTKKQKLSDLPKNEAAAINALSENFTAFKQAKGELLEKNAIYNVLGDEHGNDYWKNWPSELDKNLYNPQKGNEIKAQERIAQIKTQHAKEIDFFLFKQMLVSDTRKETAKINAQNGINTIGDSAVAFSDVDIWANQKLFKKDWNLGCPPDFFSKDGQAWGFGVLEPKHLFKKDGSLGEGGKLLFNKYETMFQDNPGGVRIDHIIGLIDPFVYKDKPTGKAAGRLYSSPNNPELQEYAKKTTEQYANIIEKIVIPAAKKAGLTEDKIICEDLGTVTEPTQKVMAALKLRGIAVTQYADASEKDAFRGRNVPERNIIMIGSHDNASVLEYTDELFQKPTELNKHAKALSEDLAPPNMDKTQFAQSIENSPTAFVAAKFAELFTSPAKKVQIFFTDLIGMKQTYNKPGTTGAQNWSLRMPEDFEAVYHKNLEQDSGLNLPQALSAAMKQKGEAFVKENNVLIQSLDNFAKILKEK